MQTINLQFPDFGPISKEGEWRSGRGDPDELYIRSSDLKIGYIVWFTRESDRTLFNSELG